MNEGNRVMMLAQRLVGGGDSEHIKVLGTELKARGWEVSVVANWLPEVSPVARSSFDDIGLTTHSIGFPIVNRSLRVGIDALTANSSLLRLIGQEQPNIVHAHWRSILPYCRTRHFPPVVFTKHLPGATGWLSNRSYQVPRRVIAISSELEDEILNRAHVARDRVRLVFHGVDPIYASSKVTDKKAIRRSLGLPLDDLVLVSVGRLSGQKDHRLTLEAAYRLKSSQPRIHLVIVGEGPLRGELTEQIEQLGLQGYVTLAGRAAPIAYLDAADIFVLSSIYEGFALAVVEGMMRGIPPIRTRTGGAVDQVQPGVTGLLFEPGDVEALVGAISRLGSDPGLRKTMGCAAQEHVRTQFTSGRMAEQTEAIYREMQA